MPVRKTSTVTSQPASQAVEARKTISFTLPKVAMPKTWTPILMGLLLVASFLLGMLFTKVQYMQSGSQYVAPSAAGQQAGAGVTTAPGKPVDVAVGNLPVMWNKDAKVKVVEFADFQCPFCEQWFKNVEAPMIADYVKTNKIAFYWRDYPFLGTESTDSSNAARCANEQGKFWDYHDYLYSNQGQENSGTFSKDNLKKFAATLGLNASQFNDCVDNGKYAKDVAADLSDGQKAGVNGTPTVFINGVPVVGAQPYTAFKAAIDAALAK